MSDDQLNSEIDRAVRQMMSVDAPGGFRARVLSKIEDRPRRFGWFALTGFGSVAAAVLLLLIVRGGAPVDPSHSGPSAPGGVPSTAWAPPPVEIPHVETPRTPAIHREAPGPQRTVIAAAVMPPQPESAIAALEEIEPLVVAPVVARDIDPAPITIAPLATIPNVRVDPLSPPQGRD